MSKYRADYTGEEIDKNISKFFNTCIVNVVTDSGSTVTMSKGDIKLFSKEENGKWTFHPLDFGSWTIKVMKQQRAVEQSITIDAIKIYNVNIDLDF